jgi:hypothetical protein
MDFTRSQGIADADVRIVPRPFTEKTTDRPELFRSTFDERARSQNWTHREKDIARITAIRDEIISNYLPLGFTADHVDDRTGEIRLHEEQKLHIYQAMCRQFRKAEYDTIPECLDELKYTKPYVNLLDLIDVFRTDQEVPIFAKDCPRRLLLGSVHGTDQFVIAIAHHHGRTTTTVLKLCL